MVIPGQKEGISRTPEQREYRAKVLVRGIFDRNDIAVTTTDHRIPLTDEQRAKIDTVWEPFARKGYFPGPLVRVQSYDLDADGRLVIVFGKTDYKEFLGTRDMKSRMEYGYDHIANPLVTSSVILTADNKILIARRGSGVDQPGEIDAIGGHIDPEKDLDGNGNIDIFKAAIKEVAEETGLLGSEIKEVKCFGLTYEYRNVSHVAASFGMKTGLSSGEILKRKAEELDVVVADIDKIPGGGDEEYILKILNDNYPLVEPEARITIALARIWVASDPQRLHLLGKKLFMKKEEI